MTAADTDFVPDDKEHRSAEPALRGRSLRSEVFAPVLIGVLALFAMFLARVALEGGALDQRSYILILWVSTMLYVYARRRGTRINCLWRLVSREVGDGLMEAISYVTGAFWLGSALAILTVSIRLLVDLLGVI
ncbi:MAG: hypothetical protein Q4B30_03130 [Coriobacteriaceae bacterium]|nr:hypothetical protein [Coriobacteriaceae bacterium]